MPVWDTIANRGALTDRSGTIAASNVSQQVSPPCPTRSYLFVQNPSSASESLFVNFTFPASTSVVNCFELLPGSSLEMKLLGFVSVEAVNVAAATPGHPFTYKEF
jgi:hypothetical protein